MVLGIYEIEGLFIFIMLQIQNILKNPHKIWEMFISIYILGLINLYLIHTYGLEGIYPIELNIDGNIWNTIPPFLGSAGGIIKMNDTNLIFLIFINILFLFIFNSCFNSHSDYINDMEDTFGINKNTTEFLFLISFGLLGLNFIVLTNDLIFTFIAIELYSLSVYLLILLKISKISTRISIIYLLINSLSSYTFLLGIALLYKYTGSILLDDIMYIINTPTNQNINSIMISSLLIIIGILLKLGTVPFNFWVLRLYTVLENRVLLYQILIPKLVFVFLLYKILSYFFLFPAQASVLNFFYIFLYIIAFLSVIIASIAGLFHTNFKAILTYSSILNMGFILFGLCNELIKYQINNNFYSHLDLLESGANWSEYLFIYTFNTLAFFFCLLLFNPKKNNTLIFFQSRPLKFNPDTSPQSHKCNWGGANIIATQYPLLSLFLLFSIFSFIGIPPFAGFYAKLNIFINILYSSDPLWVSSLIFLFLSTFISACFYLKFILYFFFPINSYISAQTTNNISSPNWISYSYSFFSLFLIFYPFISNFLYPFFNSSNIYF